MQISAGAPPPKRARGKATEEPAKLPIVTAKKPRARKPAQAEMLAGTPVEVAAQASAEDLSGLIATTAYFIAAERNFAAGCELEDWLEAERRVRGG
jgi:hypothetical protein